MYVLLYLRDIFHAWGYLCLMNKLGLGNDVGGDKGDGEEYNVVEEG